MGVLASQITVTCLIVKQLVQIDIKEIIICSALIDGAL